MDFNQLFVLMYFICYSTPAYCYIAYFSFQSNMGFQLVVLLVVISFSVSHSAIISDSMQKNVLDYQSKITILQFLLSEDCESFNQLSDLPKDNLDLMKIRYRKLVFALAACHKEKGGQYPTLIYILYNIHVHMYVIYMCMYCYMCALHAYITCVYIHHYILYTIYMHMYVYCIYVSEIGAVVKVD